MYKDAMTRQAAKDAQKIEQSGLKPKAAELIRIIRYNPYQNPPPYEKLQSCENTYSRRINIQHRLVYQVLPNHDCEKDENGVPYQGTIKIVRMWTHYERA
ncbi:MAG: Txe/YoeB family addiction module toxin [Oscillospiraceae bacterium]|nr:Txe/YoeB family addiction module toxin [Oscillospiraceae bacterium]